MCTLNVHLSTIRHPLDWLSDRKKTGAPVITLSGTQETIKRSTVNAAVRTVYSSAAADFGTFRLHGKVLNAGPNVGLFVCECERWNDDGYLNTNVGARKS